MTTADLAGPVAYVTIPAQFVYATEVITDDETGVTIARGTRGGVLFGQGAVYGDGATDVCVAFDGQAGAVQCTLSVNVALAE